MGYNTIQELYEYCGITSDKISTSIMSGFQTKSDNMIHKVNANPPAGYAIDIEADLVFQMVQRRQLITNASEGGLKVVLIDPPRITPEQRRDLVCYMPDIVKFDGYNILDN